MPIAENQLRRNFIVVDEYATVKEVREQIKATGDDWTSIVVRLADGRYAVLRLNEIIKVLQRESDVLWAGMLKAALRSLPNLLESRAADAVEQSDMDTIEAKRQMRRVPGQRLVVLADGQVLGLLIGSQRTIPDVDPTWLDQPPEQLEEAMISRPTTLSGDPKQPTTTRIEPEKRWINAELQNHEKDIPLQMGEVYTLAFDVDTELRDTAVGGAAFGYRFEEGEELVTLTVQLESDDFEIYTDPQALRVPRTGKSKGRARFDIEPKHEGEGVITAVFLKDGNFVQLVTLKLYTGAPGRVGVLSAGDPLGRPLDAAFAIQPRDVSLIIQYTGTGFQLIVTGAVGAMATLPITLQQLDQMIAQTREALLEIVHLETGPQTYTYQEGIDIPPNVNRHALQQLAKAGFRLYQRIFYGPDADAQVNLLGDKLRQMAQQETLKVQVFSKKFMLPWGLLYLAEEYDPDHVEPEMFLGLKHIIEHIPLQSRMHVVKNTIDSQPGLTVSVNVNADIDQQMGMPLIAEQERYWDRVSQGANVQVIPRLSGNDVVDALADPSTPDQIVYFYCHAISKSLTEEGGPDDSTLVLSGDHYLTLEDLNLYASTKRILPGAPLVFINACESAELSPVFYDGFVPYFMAKGARGVIGTECETPALFAAEWAKRFFTRFLSGDSLGQVVLDLRREFYYQHNNLMGLLYALYCDGDTRVVPGLQVTQVRPQIARPGPTEP